MNVTNNDYNDNFKPIYKESGNFKPICKMTKRM